MIYIAVYIILLGNLLRRKAKYRLKFVALKKLKKDVPAIILNIKRKSEVSNDTKEKTRLSQDLEKLD